MPAKPIVILLQNQYKIGHIWTINGTKEKKDPEVLERKPSELNSVI